MTRKEQLTEEAKGLGINTEGLTIPQLEKAIEDANGTDKEAPNETEKGSEETSENESADSNKDQETDSTKENPNPNGEEEEEEEQPDEEGAKEKEVVLDPIKYKSHKEVEAYQVETIVRNKQGGATLNTSEEGYPSIEVDSHFMLKHKPKAGGYYVIYADGYKSFSPQKAFEDGYEKIEK